MQVIINRQGAHSDSTQTALDQQATAPEAWRLVFIIQVFGTSHSHTSLLHNFHWCGFCRFCRESTCQAAREAARQSARENERCRPGTSGMARLQGLLQKLTKSTRPLTRILPYLLWSSTSYPSYSPLLYRFPFFLHSFPFFCNVNPRASGLHRRVGHPPESRTSTI